MAINRLIASTPGIRFQRIPGHSGIPINRACIRVLCLKPAPQFDAIIRVCALIMAFSSKGSCLAGDPITSSPIEVFSFNKVRRLMLVTRLGSVTLIPTASVFHPLESALVLPAQTDVPLEDTIQGHHCSQQPVSRS